MKKLMVILFLFILCSFTYSQVSVSVTPIYTFGKYYVNDVESGKIEPKLSWEIVANIPVNKNISVGPYLYFYRGSYIDRGSEPYKYNEKSTLIGMTFTYTFD
jgi:hypothetical protein